MTKLIKIKLNKTINIMLNSLLFGKYYFCLHEVNSITAAYFFAFTELCQPVGSKQ